MPSKTSFFDRALFVWNTKRFWPLWAGYALLWLVIGPMAVGADLSASSDRLSTAYQILHTVNIAAPAITAMAAVFFAMALYSYMYQSRSVVMLHSLPLRRETLFATNFLSGIVFFLGAHLLAALGMAFSCGVYHVLDGRAILIWFAVTTLCAVFFFGFATFCAQFTGQVLALPVFYAILNSLAVGMEGLVRTLAAGILYGYSESGDLLLLPLSPLFQMYSSLCCRYVGSSGAAVNADPSPTGYVEDGLGCLGWYALAGLVFALLAFVLYRRRSSESAGDTVSVAWAKPVFSTGVGLCFALSLGQGIYEMLCSGCVDICLTNLPKLFACMVVTGLIGFYAAEMLMRKSFRVFRETVPGAVVLCALMAAGLSVLALDPSGYETEIPAPDTIRSVEVNTAFARGVYSRFTAEDDPQVVAALLDVHQAIIDDKTDQLALRRESWAQDDAAYMVDYAADVTNESSSAPLERVTSYFRIHYVLTDGTVLEREYDLSVLRSEAAQSDTLTAKLERALNNEDVLLRSTLLWSDVDVDLDALKTVDATVTRYGSDEASGYSDKTLMLEPSDAQELFDALLRDLADGSIRNDLFEEDAYSADVTNLSFTFASSGEYHTSRDITLTEDMTNTAAVLSGLGF